MNLAENLRYLLLQVRNADDPMQTHEVESFSRVLGVSPERISVHDMLNSRPSPSTTEQADMVLLGGSGHYSAAGEGEWLMRALDYLRQLHAAGKPTFASCWGFQAMARAMGGEVIKDLQRAEVGTHTLTLTAAGRADPIFSPLGETFFGQMGHEDCVTRLPENAVLLASSRRVENQAYCFADAPIYCTQFHPELNRNDLLARVKTYPEYVERIENIPPEHFGELCRDTLETEQLLPRFVEHVFGGG
ncbi:type 1 glutamine amidotransferase [Symmachiella dynata]|uniref:type 1 glutamine amidotransferase n=1 Tax=Symmachiella dynata TaxID=2527995 RepID=UPI0030EE2606